MVLMLDYNLPRQVSRQLTLIAPYFSCFKLGGLPKEPHSVAGDQDKETMPSLSFNCLWAEERNYKFGEKLKIDVRLTEICISERNQKSIRSWDFIYSYEKKINLQNALKTEVMKKNTVSLWSQPTTSNFSINQI